jgi:hypothetical protein
VVEPPPPPPPHEPAPPPPAPEPGRCPNCGAPHDVYQEYCLECGRRLPGSHVDSRYVELWRRDSPIWLWAALAALLLVALVAGAVVALAASNDDKSGSPAGPATATTLPATSTIATAPPTITIEPPTTTFGTTTFSTTTIGTTTLGTTTFGTTTSSSYLQWPAGKDGFTIVLKSVPTSNGRGPAEAAADKAKTNGLPQVGILNSSDYSSLNPGYYVTFSGIYDNQSQANAGLSNARSKGFPTAYVREVSN